MLHRQRLQLFCQRQDLNPGSILGQPRIDPTKNIIEKTSSKKTSSKKHHRKNIIEKKHHPKNIIEKKTSLVEIRFGVFCLS